MSESRIASGWRAIELTTGERYHGIFVVINASGVYLIADSLGRAYPLTSIKYLEDPVYIGQRTG
jgi:hypothetical protein